MADEKRAGPWVQDEGVWVRWSQSPSQFAAWVFYSTTQECWAWHASVAAMGYADTPDRWRACVLCGVGTAWQAHGDRPANGGP